MGRVRSAPESLNHPANLAVPVLAADAVKGFRLGIR
jgi:hypothetical protein